MTSAFSTNSQVLAVVFLAVATGLGINALGHKITVFRRGDNYEGLDTFWDYLYQHSVDDSVMLEAADGQTTISYEAYYTSASQDMEKVEGSVNYWGEIEVSFVPIDAQVKP